MAIGGRAVRPTWKSAVHFGGLGVPLPFGFFNEVVVERLVEEPATCATRR